MPPTPSLGVMQLVHARHQYLRAIWTSLPQLGVPIHLQICLSRPTVQVLEAVQDVMDQGLPGTVPHTIQIIQAPFNPLEHGRPERFMELRQFQLEQLPPTDYGVIWDDDHFLEDGREASRVLRRWPDLVYATKEFYWNDLYTVARHFPVHRSVFFFRRVPGERFPLDRMIHAPVPIHDNAETVKDLRSKLLDFGYLSEADRHRCWADYKGVGKIDPATLALVAPPKLELARREIPKCLREAILLESQRPAR